MPYRTLPTSSIISRMGEKEGLTEGETNTRPKKFALTFKMFAEILPKVAQLLQ